MIHYRRPSGFTRCGLGYMQGEGTDDPALVTCRVCLRSLASRPPLGRMVLRFLAGASLEEVAAEFGVSVEAVDDEIRRAMR